VHGLRPDYQDEVNFVVLDYDIKEQRAFAAEMAAARHPAFAVIPPNSGPDAATDLHFGPFNEDGLREFLDGVIATYGS
jgi:hypothetical protein